MIDEEIEIIDYAGNTQSVSNIIRVEELNGETILFMTDGSFSKSVLSIDVLEWELPKTIFKRVHPNHLINTNFSAKYFTIHTQWIELENGEKIPTNPELFPVKHSRLVGKLLNVFKKSKNNRI